MRSVRSRGFHSRRCYRGGLRLPDGLSGALGWKYADEPARAALIFKAYVASNTGKQRVVFPAPHVQAGLVFGPSLTNQNGPGIDELPREALHTQPLSRRVPAVYRRSATFFMCHNLTCFRALSLSSRASSRFGTEGPHCASAERGRPRDLLFVLRGRAKVRCR